MRKGGRVRLLSVLVATGINREGYREILGLTLGDSESEASWSEFFDRLKARGLKGVDLVVSDDHKGLVKPTNGVERLNQEIRRRERVIRIFPNEESAVRLIGAVLVEIDEAWSSGPRYFDMAEYWEWKANTEKQRKEVSNADTHVSAA